jgi:hypothetical protein
VVVTDFRLCEKLLYVGVQASACLPLSSEDASPDARPREPSALPPPSLPVVASARLPASPAPLPEPLAEPALEPLAEPALEPLAEPALEPLAEPALKPP